MTLLQSHTYQLNANANFKQNHTIVQVLVWITLYRFLQGGSTDIFQFICLCRCLRVMMMIVIFFWLKHTCAWPRWCFKHNLKYPHLPYIEMCSHCITLLQIWRVKNVAKINVFFVHSKQLSTLQMLNCNDAFWWFFCFEK